MAGRVLLVDDDDALCETLILALGRRGFAVASRGDGESALEAIADEDFDVVVTDLHLRGQSGIELCERVVASRPDVPVIVITAFGSLETAVAAIRVGAYDFITKPIELDALRIALDRALRHRSLSDEVRRLRRVAAVASELEGLIGESPAMRKVLDQVARVAITDASVLITGESGTGKELIARAIHRRSKRADRPFVAINCAAMPEPLLESELFGHVRGAFTDAVSPRTGLFVQASGGTVFLDEIGELPIGLQPKLLRVIQERRVRAVGADTELELDVRFVSATNTDLEQAIEDRLFREDLYYRLDVVHLRLPPLRARGDSEILRLAHRFLADASERNGKPIPGLTTAAAERLVAYTWPGNVRELANCMERAVALAKYDQITIDDLPERIRAYQPRRIEIVAARPEELVSMAEVERRYILEVLEAYAGNRSLAAQTLGMDRKTLYRKLKAYGIEPA